MGRFHKAFIVTSVFVFLFGTAAAIALPRRASQSLPAPPLTSRELIIPVEGVAAAALTDTWGAARSQGRKHEGIDIMASAGTPVKATAGGRIAKFFESKRSGRTIYEFDRDGRLIFYYAHLQSYAAGLMEGQTVEQGQLIGYVGSTGSATVPHLHFEIQHAASSAQWWRGEAFNPYLRLKTARLP